MENGFNMWSFNGKLLYSLPRDRFQQLSWRPRVPSLLTKEKEEEIKKNLKEYSKCVGCQQRECMRSLGGGVTRGSGLGVRVLGDGGKVGCEWV